jgi:hypothetical protein
MGIFKCIGIGLIGTAIMGVASYRLVINDSLQTDGWVASTAAMLICITTAIYLIGRKP